jgi:PAS domain S-box-containing protein
MEAPRVHDDRGLRWHSLRWRLPLLISASFIAVLAFVVFAAYREVESTLRDAAGDRARNAATQVANILSRSTLQSLEQLQRVAPELREYLRDPTDAHRTAARASLAPLNATPARRITVWAADGTMLFTVPDTVPDTRSVPPPTRPAEPGFSPIRAVRDVAFTDVGVVIDGAMPERSKPLGSVSMRSRLAITPPDLFNRLFGANVHFLFGNRSGDVWTDLTRVVAGPTVSLDADGVKEYRAPDGDLRIGALSGLQGTPWVVWVDYPRSALVARARVFLARMAIVGLLAVIAAVVMIGWSTFGVGRLGTAMAELNERSQDRERYLATIVDSSSDAIIGKDLNGIVTSWNKGAEDLFGYSSAEMIGRSTLELIPPDRRDEEEHILSRIRAGQRVLHFETVRRTKDGRLLDMSITTSPIRDASGAIIGASKVARDITERRVLQEQYHQAQKMEAIGQLAGGVAHDFNNLLTAVLGFSGLVRESLDADDPRLGDVDQIIMAAERASALTKQLLAFSRKEVVQPVTLDLNEVIVNTDKMLRRLIGEQIVVRLALADRIGPIQADPGQLDQILMNLAINAHDAMPDGGRLTIETANVELDAPFASTHGTASPGPYVMLAVTDTGVGMSDDVRRRLFEPFFTTKERGKGTGLGLSTVFGIVQQSGGCMYVYSEPGHGATFKIYFPRVTASSDAVPAFPERPPARGTETVLLVEDEQAVRLLVRSILELAGYRVVEADSPRAAVAVFAERRSDVHVLVTDVIMPGETGPALFESLRASRPHLRVLYISGYTDDAMRGRLDPGVAFVQKPFAADALLRKLREVLDTAAN